MARRLLVVLLSTLVVWAIPAPRTNADTSPYLNVWVRYDYMVGPGYSDAPSAGAMQMVVDAFKAHGVTLHVDPQHTAIPAHKVIVPDWQSEYASTPGFDDPSCTGPDAVRFSALKTQYFHPSSSHPWHYAIFGDLAFGDTSAHLANCPATVENSNAPPLYGMAGDSQVGFLDVQGGLGYDFVVTFGAWRAAGVPVPDMTEAAIFMHELGHNFGLSHGGSPFSNPGVYNPLQLNYKPNYLSVMNYNFEFTGIPYAATPGSTTIAGYRLDYSDVKLPDLNEANLDETVGLQDSVHPTDITYWTLSGIDQYAASASGPIDWNQDGNATETSVAADIDGDDFGGIRRQVLSGSDDWAWIHARLTPPAITQLLQPSLPAGVSTLSIIGSNLMGPAMVIFGGGSSAPAFSLDFTDPYSGDVTTTRLDVVVPPGAQSGPVTVVTPEGSATSSQSLTISPGFKIPTSITAGPDGNIWFTEDVGNIGRVRPSGAIKEFPLPSGGSDPTSITAGPDGNLWFTESGGDKIGRITPSGTISEFSPPSNPSPCGRTVPSWIATGPDGNLWFTESCLNQVGRITPSGVVSEFPLPSQGLLAPVSVGEAITAGPDGNVWLTLGGGNGPAIARVTTFGAVTEFPLPSWGYLGAIAAGPDGNLWFTEVGTSMGPEIGRITPIGAITEFPVPSNSDELGGITAGWDGNVWFSDYQANTIGRVTPTGTITKFSLPSAGFPWAIAAGPDGNMWFTIQQAIGRITPSGTITEFPLP